MISAVVLNKEIKCETICQEVQRLVNNYNRENGNAVDTVLIMQIKKIVDSQEDSGSLRLIDKTESV
jgi:hypothetical protein